MAPHRNREVVEQAECSRCLPALRADTSKQSDAIRCSTCWNSCHQRLTARVGCLPHYLPCPVACWPPDTLCPRWWSIAATQAREWVRLCSALLGHWARPRQLASERAVTSGQAQTRPCTIPLLHQAAPTLKLALVLRGWWIALAEHTYISW